jgi:hypothetical protein
MRFCAGAAEWVTGDDVYGNDPAFRAGVAELGSGYVLAGGCNHRVSVKPRRDSDAR